MLYYHTMTFKTKNEIGGKKLDIYPFLAFFIHISTCIYEKIYFNTNHSKYVLKNKNIFIIIMHLNRERMNHPSSSLLLKLYTWFKFYFKCFIWSVVFLWYPVKINGPVFCYSRVLFLVCILSVSHKCISVLCYTYLF